jgi:putative ABC transport system ATP-binding protein
MSDLAIELAKVSRRFREGEREHVVLDGADLVVRRGETVALRGRSGSGKSTLLNIIAGIDLPDSGSVVVAGQDLVSLPERERTLFRRAHIGFVYQSFNLLPTLTVADNIRLVLELNAMPRLAADARIAALLDAVGLGDRADSYPDLLSGGEQQRVAIARALCHSPAILLADEPTGNLDDEAAQSVLALLHQLVGDAGGTLLIATHSAGAAALCDRVLELRHGRLDAPPSAQP